MGQKYPNLRFFEPLKIDISKNINFIVKSHRTFFNCILTKNTKKICPVEK